MMKTSLCILPVLALTALAGGGCASAGGFGPAPESLLKSGAWPGRPSSANLQPVTDKVAGLVSPKAKAGKLVLAGEQIPVALDAATADGELNVIRLDLQTKGDFTAATVLKLSPPPPRQVPRVVDGKTEMVTLPPPPNYMVCEGFMPGPAGRVFVQGSLYVATAVAKDGAKLEFTNFSLRTINVRVGKAPVAGVDRAVALIDSDGNGIYNDAFDPQNPATQGRQYNGGDAVMVDFGKGDFADRKQVKSVMLDRYLMLDGKPYELQVDPSGNGLKIDPAVIGQGKISFAAAGLKVQATLIGRRMEVTVPVDSPAAGTDVPVGTYQISLLQVKDPDSKAMIYLRGGKAVEVLAGKTSVVPIDAKLNCQISASPMTADRQIKLSANRMVAGGLTVAGVYGKDGKPAPVGFEVLAADGKKIDAGNFEFG